MRSLWAPMQKYVIHFWYWEFYLVHMMSIGASALFKNPFHSIYILGNTLLQ